MANSTQFYQADKTELYSSRGSEEHQLSIGQKIILNDSEYTILSIISENSGEAVIYKIEDLEGKIFALKMYFQFQNSKDEPNPEALQRILKITDPDLLKLNNFGIGENKYEGKFCFEISKFAEGGDLLSIPNFKEKYDLEFLKTKVIPQIFKGIRTLHRHKIIHCDLKPQNVFFRDKKQINLVIGDYGSAKTFDLENGKNIRRTSTIKGTDFYLPPEQARGFISEKNDYYSFGMILLHLVYPGKVCQNTSFSRLNRQKLKQIIENQFENRPIIEFDESKGRINDLIAGLTLSNVYNRWGEFEVRRWLSGGIPIVNYDEKDAISEIKWIDLGDRIIRTESDLIEFMESDSEWYEILIEDRTGRDLFNRWLISIRDIAFQRKVSNLIAQNQQHGIVFIKETLIRSLQPYYPILLNNKAYNFGLAHDLRFETVRYFGRLLKGNYTEEELKLYIFRYKLALEYCAENDAKRNLYKALITSHKKVQSNSKDPFPTKHFSVWLQHSLLKLVKRKHIKHIVHFEQLTKNGIECKIIKSLTPYLSERGDDLNIEFVEMYTFDYPNYSAREDRENRLYFSSDLIYESTIESIEKIMPLDKNLVFGDFEKFKEELDRQNPMLLINSLPKSKVFLDVEQVENVGNKVNSPVNVFYQARCPEIYWDNHEVYMMNLLIQPKNKLIFNELDKNEITERIKYEARIKYGNDIKIEVTDDKKLLQLSFKYLLIKYFPIVFFVGFALIFMLILWLFS